MESVNFLLMQHELVLIAIALIVLMAEIGTDEGKKWNIYPITLILFLAHTIIGFYPIFGHGELFGGMYTVSPLSLMMKNCLNIGVLIILLQCSDWFKKLSASGRMTEVLLLLISTLIGMSFMISAGDFLMFYMGLELATLPIAALAAYETSKDRSAEAGIKLILSSALSSAVLLMGVSFMYAIAGNLYFSEFSQNLDGSALQIAGFIFFVAGIGFKISAVPFHLWTADVYEGAPVNITSYLSVISKGAAVFIASILFMQVFHGMADVWERILYALAIATMTVGNLFAIRQQNLKRFLAFSSIAQAGFILLGIIEGGRFGMTAVVYFMLIYIFSNLGAFGVISSVYYFTGKENRDDYNGFYLTNPKLSLVMLISLFSLAGIPPVAGFFGKFFLFAAAASKGYYVLVLIATINAVVSLYYYLLVVKAIFINKSEKPIDTFNSNFYMKTSLLICSAGIIFIGLISMIYEHIFALANF